MAYHRIVVGTDGSITASVAVDRAARIAKRSRAQVLVVCVYQPPGLTRVSAESVLGHAVRDVERLRVEVVPVLRDGDPVPAILGVTREVDADLLVVGNRGMGHPRRLRLGPVPDQIAHSGRTDVLVAHTRDATSETPTKKGYHRMLIGTDGSPTANECARKGMELALLMGADVVTLIYVGDPIVGAIRLEETAESAPDGLDIERKITSGEPAEAIIRMARQEDADLIVVGNKGMAGARRLLGSVPNAVVHSAPSDVLIAKTVDRTLDEVQPGHGAVLDVEGKRVAVFRDDDGTVHAVSSRCTHMGCTVDWNDAERTWDCPCHGSRYAWDGQVIRGPAAKALAPQEVVDRGRRRVRQ